MSEPHVNGDVAEMARGERIYSTVVFALLALLGAGVVVHGLSLGVGSLDGPGPGLWPLVIGVIWVASAIVAGVYAVRGADRLEPLVNLSAPLKGVGLTVLFVLLFSYVGFVVSVVVTLVLWLKLLTDFPWRRILVVTLVVGGLLYLLFGVIVGTAFPASLIPIG
jgi:putative tricarboxylic transport membrane protein